MCRFVQLTKATFAGLSKTDFKFPKMHDAVHFPDFIEMYGAVMGFCAAPFETAHRPFVKAAWDASNKQKASFRGQVGCPQSPADQQLGPWQGWLLVLCAHPNTAP